MGHNTPQGRGRIPGPSPDDMGTRLPLDPRWMFDDLAGRDGAWVIRTGELWMIVESLGFAHDAFVVRHANCETIHYSRHATVEDAMRAAQLAHGVAGREN